MIGNFDRSFGLRTFDDQNTVVGGVMSSQFSGGDPTILATVGHLSGSVTNTVLPQYANSSMPLIVPASSADVITSHGYRNVFRLPTKDSTEGMLFAHFLAHTYRPKRAVALTQDGDYGGDVARGFARQMELEKVPTDVLTFAQTKPALADVAQKILATGADYLYLAGNTETMGPLLPVLRGAGFLGTFGASQGFYNPLTIARYSHDLANVLVSSSMPPLDKVQAVNDDLSELRGNYGEVTPLTAFGFAATQLAINAIQRTGAVDRLSLIRALANSASYDTLVGTFNFAFSGDPADPNLYFYSLAGGKFTYVNSAHSSSFLIGS